MNARHLSKTSTMYLIQRKADGLFYKNSNSYVQFPQTNWSARLGDCRPFKTTGGAKTSNGWNEWKTTLTPDACEKCKVVPHKNYGCYWEHTFSERYGVIGARLRPNIHFWIEKNGRKPCFIISRISEEENPLRIVPVKMQLALE